MGIYRRSGDRENDAGKKADDYLIVNPPDETLTSGVIDRSQLPLVSFCIPTKNNEGTLENCLKSIIAQDYPSVEILIIDGCSSDRTLEIAQKYTDKIFYDPGGYGSACQTGIGRSSGEIIALFDSDIIIPHKNWLVNSVKFFNYRNDVSTVWPVNVPPPGSSLTTRLYFNLWKITIEDRINRGRGVFGGGNSLFRKKYFLEIGGVDSSIHWGADFDWAAKFRSRGYRVVLVQDPLYHDTMRTMHEFYRKQCSGAGTFTEKGFGMMGLSAGAIVQENLVLGFRGMIRGLIRDRDPSWLLYPAFLAIRLVVYSGTFAGNRLHRKGIP